MGNAGREDHGAAPLCQAVPMAYDVADQLPHIHPGGELLLDIVAAFHLHARQIWQCGRIDLGWYKIAGRDQLGDRRTFDDRIEGIAQAAAIASTRGRRQTQDDRLGVGRQQTPVDSGRGMVRLVDDNKVGGRQIHGAGPYCPEVQSAD